MKHLPICLFRGHPARPNEILAHFYITQIIPFVLKTVVLRRQNSLRRNNYPFVKLNQQEGALLCFKYAFMDCPLLAEAGL